MVNCHIKKYLIIFFVLVQGAVAFSCASDDEVLEVVDLSVNKEMAGTCIKSRKKQKGRQ